MPSPTAHERRVSRRLEARGLAGLGEALTRLDGTEFGGRYRLESLFAAGAEGAVFLASDTTAGDRYAPYCAKIPLLQYHRPILLDTESIRRRRAALREESRHLSESGSVHMPRSLGLFEMRNRLLDPARGEAFGESEPVLLMERLPGRDLDVWLARMHRSRVDVKLLRRTLDSVVVAVLQGLWDLQTRGFYYADLRPGNVRIGGRDRRARLLDAGSLVRRSDCSGRFPHVPAYLPPQLFLEMKATECRPFPTAAVQAVMCGRSLYEVATGDAPMPGEEVDRKLLWDSRVSQPVADTIDGLCSGSFTDVQQALKYLNKRAVRRAPSRLVAVGAAAGPASASALALDDAPPPPRPAPVPVASSPRAADPILPPSAPKPWWRRVLGR